MNKIYLIVGSTHSAIAVYPDYGLDALRDLPAIGNSQEVWEIGIARPETPPGCLMVGTSDELSPYRPLGKKV